MKRVLYSKREVDLETIRHLVKPAYLQPKYLEFSNKFEFINGKLRPIFSRNHFCENIDYSIATMTLNVLCVYYKVRDACFLDILYDTEYVQPFITLVHAYDLVITPHSKAKNHFLVTRERPPYDWEEDKVIGTLLGMLCAGHPIERLDKDRYSASIDFVCDKSKGERGYNVFAEVCMSPPSVTIENWLVSQSYRDLKLHTETKVKKMNQVFSRMFNGEFVFQMEFLIPIETIVRNMKTKSISPRDFHHYYSELSKFIYGNWRSDTHAMSVLNKMRYGNYTLYPRFPYFIEWMLENEEDIMDIDDKSLKELVTTTEPKFHLDKYDSLS